MSDGWTQSIKLEAYKLTQTEKMFYLGSNNVRVMYQSDKGSEMVQKGL